MYEWQGKFEKLIGDDDLIIKTFNDSGIMLDCICDTRYDAIEYMLNKCLSYGHENGLLFVGFEITGE